MTCLSCGRGKKTVDLKTVEIDGVRCQLCVQCAPDRFRVEHARRKLRGEA